jgi:hypothetical protein
MQQNSGEKRRTDAQVLDRHNSERELDSMWEIIFNGRKIEALYLWFVFMNQPAMAKYLCSRSRVRYILCTYPVYFL